MTSTVRTLMESTGLTWAGAVAWSAHVPLNQPGVYVISASESPRGTTAFGGPPISPLAVQTLLDTRPELLVDGRRPDVDELTDRLRSMWLPDENILYVGLAGTSVANRVDQYYKTKLGARSPHAGGWPLKTLIDIDQLWVHYAACATADVAEHAMLDTFMTNVSAASRAASCDPNLPLPFANLTAPRGPRKQHGITGAREPRAPKSSPAGTPTTEQSDVLAPIKATAYEGVSPEGLTQPMRPGDFKAGRIRIPGATKPLFPECKTTLDIVVRGQSVEARWDPRYGPDRDRSGVLSVGRAIVAALQEGGRLTVIQHSDGTVELS